MSAEVSLTASSETPRSAVVATSRSPATIAPVVISVAVVVLANLGSARQWFFRWMGETSPGAGWLLVIAALVAAYRARRHISLVERPHLAGVVLIYLGFVGKLGGQLAMMPFVDRAGVYLQVVGLLYLWTGFAGTLGQWRTLLLLLAAIPIPVSIQGPLYAQAGELAATAFSIPLELLGFTVFPGTGGTFEVFAGTSPLLLDALHMPFYFVALALVISFARQRGVIAGMLLASCSLPLALLGNGCRTIASVWLGVDAATTGAVPALLDWAMLPPSLVLLILLDWCGHRAFGRPKP